MRKAGSRVWEAPCEGGAVFSSFALSTATTHRCAQVETAKDDPGTKQYAQLLYDVAAVASGYEVADPGAFAKRVVAMMSGGVVEGVGT